MNGKFVLLSTQRSGSTWVIDMLNSHPEIVAYGELFLEGGQGQPPWGARDLVFFDTYLTGYRGVFRRALKAYLYVRYLNRVFSRREGVRAVGFKLMYGQAGAHPWVFRYMRGMRVAVVHLIRRNAIDMLVSRETAVLRDVFHARQGEDVADVKIQLNPSTLLKQLERGEQQQKKARERCLRLHVPFMEVTYETLVSTEGEFGRILEFLGVAPSAAPLASALRKLNTRPHRDLIENYNAVAQALQGTRFQELLR